MRRAQRTFVAPAGALSLVAALCAGGLAGALPGVLPGVGVGTAGAVGTAAPIGTAAPTVRTTKPGAFSACLVTNVGGIDDTLDAWTWQGMEDAAQASSSITVKYTQPKSTSTYLSDIDALVAEKCGIVVTVGSAMGAATEAAAKAHPTQEFAIADDALEPVVGNVDALGFDTVQAAFLAGYLAAGLTRTGMVATYGGKRLPTVERTMDGFWDGVEYYDTKHSTDVQILGWTEKTQSGEIAGTFADQAKGRTIARTFIGDGADIIFPVAGDTGLGTARAVQSADEAGGRVNMIWSGTDGCVSEPTYCKYFLTSVTEDVPSALKSAVLSAASGAFEGGDDVATLANGGVALAPYHDWTSKVPHKLKVELAEVEQGIESGKIPTATKSPV